MTKTKAVQIQEYAQGYRKGELRRVSAQLKWLSTALDQAERRGEKVTLLVLRKWLKGRKICIHDKDKVRNWINEKLKSHQKEKK